MQRLLNWLSRHQGVRQLEEEEFLDSPKAQKIKIRAGEVGVVWQWTEPNWERMWKRKNDMGRKRWKF